MQRRVPELLTTGETAKLLGCCTVTVRDYAKRRYIHEIRVGSGMRLFLRDDVLEFKRQRDERRQAAERLAG
jgi:excisionase family DNA binding protein